MSDTSRAMEAVIVSGRRRDSLKGCLYTYWHHNNSVSIITEITPNLCQQLSGIKILYKYTSSIPFCLNNVREWMIKNKLTGQYIDIGIAQVFICYKVFSICCCQWNDDNNLNYRYRIYSSSNIQAMTLYARRGYFRLNMDIAKILKCSENSGVACWWRMTQVIVSGSLNDSVNVLSLHLLTSQ